MSQKQKIEELEKRIKELEQRPVTIWPVYIPMPMPQPYNPYQPYTPVPYNPPGWPVITC